MKPKSIFPGILVRFNYETASSIKSNNDLVNELHINLWELTDREFLDVGVKFDNRQKIQSIEFDLPFEAKSSDIVDLGHALNTEEIIGAIFNDVVRYSSSNEDQKALIEINGNEISLLKLNENHIKIKQIRSKESESSVIGIDVSKFDLKENEIAYFRLRIKNIPSGMYCSKFDQKDKNILSSAIETSIVDFRVNVRRGIPQEILTRDSMIAGEKHKLKFPELNKIHVFFITEREKEISFEGENFVACRSLHDEAIWDNYIRYAYSTSKKIKNVSHLLGYQWTTKKKENSCVKDLNALARFTKVISGRARLVQFLIMAAVLGGIGNATWETAKIIFTLDLFKSKFGDLINSTSINEVFGPGILLLILFIPIYLWCAKALSFIWSGVVSICNFFGKFLLKIK